MTPSLEIDVRSWFAPAYLGVAWVVLKIRRLAETEAR